MPSWRQPSQNFSACESELAEIESEIASFDAKKNELEKKIDNDRGAKSQERPKLKRDRDSAEEKLKEVQDQFLTMCGELLPFAMLADLGTQLEHRLDLERKTTNWLVAKDATYPPGDETR